MQRSTMNTQEDLLHLRNWMSSQPHLPPVSVYFRPLDASYFQGSVFKAKKCVLWSVKYDKQLTLFLHSCKFHLELTKKTIETYFSVKTNAPEFFSERDPVNAEIQQIKDVIQLAPLPEKSPEGYKILMGRLIDTDPSNYQLNSCIKFLFMVIDACQEVEGPQSGLVYIFDMQGVAFGHLSRINLMSVKKYFLYSQEGMPVRLKAVHILNVNSVISQVMAIIKQFISKDRIQMIHLHTGVPQEFLNVVPQRLLPSDYNGNQPPLGQLFDDTLKTLRNLREWFMEDEKLKSDESKRDKTRSQRSSFGMDGSFKKLDID